MDTDLCKAKMWLGIESGFTSELPNIHQGEIWTVFVSVVIIHKQDDGVAGLQTHTVTYLFSGARNLEQRLDLPYNCSRKKAQHF